MLFRNACKIIQRTSPIYVKALEAILPNINIPGAVPKVTMINRNLKTLFHLRLIQFQRRRGSSVGDLGVILLIKIFIASY
jgi:hypothetical protein